MAEKKSETQRAGGLTYIGRGVFLPGVPARDLSAVEVERFGGAKKLIQSGLYEPVRDGE